MAKSSAKVNPSGPGTDVEPGPPGVGGGVGVLVRVGVAGKLSNHIAKSLLPPGGELSP